MEPFITTFTGRKVNPLNLKVEDIDIFDIAHHLATLNRFVGALPRPVSIAQHSVYVSRLLDDTGLEREGLFHDAAEAYLGDVSRWVKKVPEMAAYRELEDKAWIVIAKALDLDYEVTPETNFRLREADDLMVRYEAYRSYNQTHLFEQGYMQRPTTEECLKINSWAPWTWQASERGFLDRARGLGYEV